MKANILIVDDDRLIRKTLARNTEDMGHIAVAVGTLSDGFDHMMKTPFDVVFLDVRLPDGNGLDALPKMRHMPSEPEVIIITGAGEAEGAELAIKSGAWDYIQKPFSRKEIMLHIVRSLDYRRKKSSKRAFVSLKREQIIGNSPQINTCMDMVAQSANSDANVLITGETGTGKELIANAVHENSSRSDKKFVVVDCAALPETLVESVLFGHVKGAFTGADQYRDGLIQQADGGTLFLDEVGELPQSIQKSFLRVLQERKFRPVGDSSEKKSNFRLIAATNRPVDFLEEPNHFRPDLLFRLRTIHIELPSLRERKQDINSLVQYYVNMLCSHHGLETKGIIPETIEIFLQHDWPGNVRELINTLEETILADIENPILYPMILPDSIRVKYAQSMVSEKLSGTINAVPGINNDHEHQITIPKNLLNPIPTLKNFRESGLAQIECEYLNHLMSETNGDMDEATRISDLSKARLYALLKKHSLTRSHK